MSEHSWIKHVVVPVSVVSDPFSTEGFFATHTDEAQGIAEGLAVYGCVLCSTPLNTETVNTECPGYDPEQKG